METGIFEKYGQAFVSGVADYQKAIDEIETLTAALRRMTEFIVVLGSPKILKTDKKKMLGQIVQPFFDERLDSFVKVIVDNSRERFLIEILEATLALLYAKTGVKRGFLFTSAKLTESEIAMIEDKLSLKLNSQVRLKQRIDPSLLGGIKVALDDKVFDATLKKRLEELKISLLGGYIDENKNQ